MLNRWLWVAVLVSLFFGGPQIRAEAAVMVPLRAVLEDHGVDFWWDGLGVSGSWEGHTIRVIPERDYAWRDGARVMLEAEVASLNGAAFVPASFFEGLFEEQPAVKGPSLTLVCAEQHAWRVGVVTPKTSLTPVGRQDDTPIWLLPSLDDGVVKAFLERINAELQAASNGAGRIDLTAVHTLQAAVAAKQSLVALPTLWRLGGATIAFNPSGAYNNMRNAVNAAKHLNRAIVPPGEVFSFNAVLGPRTVDKGYVVGVAFEGKRHVPSLGGGVCRLSTVVYNAVLDVGLPVVERHAHSLPVGYVPKGRDATVSYGGADLKFRNNRLRSLMVEAGGNVRRLSVSIWELRDGVLPVGLSWPLLDAL